MRTAQEGLGLGSPTREARKSALAPVTGAAMAMCVPAMPAIGVRELCYVSSYVWAHVRAIARPACEPA